MLKLILSLLLALGSTASGGGPGPVGAYRLAGEPDVASILELRADGRFRYYLAAGALDERAEGRWRAEGDRIVLVTEPAPVAPAFERAPASSSRAAPLSVSVRWPDGRGIAGVDLRIGFDGGAPVEDYTQEEGWRMAPGEKRTPRWIELAVPMHGLVSPRFPIDPGAGNALAFILHPNDLGVIDFSGIRVEAAGDALIVHRGDARLRYRRVADGDGP